MKPETRRELPSSGQLLGFAIKHLGLREEVGTDRTTQRIFQGERVSRDSTRETIAKLVASFWPVSAFNALGSERSAKVQSSVVDLIGELAQNWDTRRNELYVRLRPGEPALVFFPLLRLTALELGMQLGAFAWIQAQPDPSKKVPYWTYDDGFGRKIDSLLSTTQSLRSRARLAEKADVTANTMSSWSNGDAFPTSENIERLAIELADDSGAEREAVELSLRLHLLLFWARKSMCDLLGKDVTNDLIDGALWVASKIWDLAHRQGIRVNQNLIELVHLGAKSLAGGGAITYLAKLAPNALMSADLQALPEVDWIPRLRVWLPIMMSDTEVAVEARRFFPQDNFDPQKVFKKLLDETPAPAMLSATAHMLMGFGLFAEAADLWERATCIEPTDPMHHYNFAAAHMKAHNESRASLERALEECRIAVQLDDTHTESRIQICAILVDLKQFDEAFAQYAKTKELAPESARLEFDWGHALMELGRDLEAAQHYEAATKIEPNYVDAWANLCFVLNRAGRKREAREAAKQAEFLGFPYARMDLDGEQ